LHGFGVFELLDIEWLHIVVRIVIENVPVRAYVLHMDIDAIVDNVHKSVFSGARFIDEAPGGLGCHVADGYS
jgi:hypothetical protein